jgi:hypothetical protein
MAILSARRVETADAGSTVRAYELTGNSLTPVYNRRRATAPERHDGFSAA